MISENINFINYITEGTRTVYRAVHADCDTIQKFKMLINRGVFNGILNILIILLKEF
jgi:hypothetical protein